MQALADYAGASVALGTRDRLDLIYVEHCRSKRGVMLRLGLGSRIRSPPPPWAARDRRASRPNATGSWAT
jgi:hypothetical protein